MAATCLLAERTGADVVGAPIPGQGGRLDTLIDAGIERYQAGAYREAIAILNSVTARQPAQPEARLCLSLSHLRLGEDGAAAQHLAVLRSSAPSAGVRSQADHLLEALRAGPLPPPTRRFVVAALEEAMVVSRPVRSRAVTGGALGRNFPYLP